MATIKHSRSTSTGKDGIVSDTLALNPTRANAAGLSEHTLGRQPQSVRRLLLFPICMQIA